MVSLNHNIWKSAAAIGPIVTFTANMPALLGHMMKSIPGFKELPDGITFWITGINSSKFNNKLFGIEGGIVLSNVDRKITELI